MANIQKIDFPNTRASFVKYSRMVGGCNKSVIEYHSRHERMLLPSSLQTSRASVGNGLDCDCRPPPSIPISYTLPDNTEVHLDQDSFYLPEVMMVGTGTVSELRSGDE